MRPGPATAVTLGRLIVTVLVTIAPGARDAVGQPTARSAVAPGAQAAAASDEDPPAWRRWIDPQVGTIGTRYRFVESDLDEAEISQLQHKAAVRVRFKVDAAGAYGVTVAGVTGSSFSGSWNAAGPGTGEASFDFFARQIFASALPRSWIELQVGSLYIQRGETTEVIGYDNDGYLAGERLTLRHPSQLFFDEVSVTAGYLDDVREPNAFSRAHRLSDWNYGQVLVTKRLRAALALTVEYTANGGQHLVRTAAVMRSRRTGVVDTIRAEQYARLDAAAFGFNVEGQKTLAPRLAVGLGVADIDAFAGVLNADRFGRGRRIYASAASRLAPDLMLQTWVGRAVGDTRGLATLTRFDVLLEYDLLGSLTRNGILR